MKSGQFELTQNTPHPCMHIRHYKLSTLTSIAPTSFGDKEEFIKYKYNKDNIVSNFNSQSLKCFELFL